MWLLSSKKKIHLAIGCKHKTAVSKRAWGNRTKPQLTNRPPTFYNTGNNETTNDKIHGKEALTRRELHQKLEQSQNRVKELEEQLKEMELLIAKALQEAKLATTLAMQAKNERTRKQRKTGTSN